MPNKQYCGCSFGVAVEKHRTGCRLRIVILLLGRRNRWNQDCLSQFHRNAIKGGVQGFTITIAQHSVISMVSVQKF